jgi:hypothetical protein
MGLGRMQAFLIGVHMRRWVSHYLPVFLSLFFAVLPILVGKALQKPGNDPAISTATAVAGWLADINLGMISFWVWAVVTIAHDGRLVKTSGKREGKVKERQEEFAFVLILTLLAIVVYILCRGDLVVGLVAYPLTLFSVLSPILVLRQPPL